MDKFLTEQFSEALLLEQVGAHGNTFLLAYENNQPAGYVFLSEGSTPALNTTKAIEICRLYARTSFIGKGIGKALMEAAIAFALSQQKESIWLGVWEHNQRAIKFYTSFGFEKFGEHDFLLGDDVQRDWLMNLDIKSHH
jgi:ribosomal protein S18 acetylase RimI-like enzyme